MSSIPRSGLSAQFSKLRFEVLFDQELKNSLRFNLRLGFRGHNLVSGRSTNELSWKEATR